MVEPAAADRAAWATPGAPADDAPPPTPAVGVAVAGARPADLPSTPLGPPPVPVPLRAMSVTDRLDGAFRTLKLAPGPVLALAAVVVLPTQLLGALAARVDGGREGWEVVLDGSPAAVLVDTRVVPATLVLLVALALVGQAFVAAGVARMVSAWYVGRRTTTAEVFAGAGRRLPALVASWFLVALAALVGSLLFLVGALVPLTWSYVVAPVVGVEEAGPVAALRRSYELTRRSFWMVLGTFGAAVSVDLLLRFLLGIVVVTGGLDGSGAGAVVAAVIGGAIQLLTTAFVAGVVALTYVDLRVRIEGVDIELAAVERFPGG